MVSAVATPRQPVFDCGGARNLWKNGSPKDLPLGQVL